MGELVAAESDGEEGAGALSIGQGFQRRKETGTEGWNPAHKWPCLSSGLRKLSPIRKERRLKKKCLSGLVYQCVPICKTYRTQKLFRIKE